MGSGEGQEDEGGQEDDYENQREGGGEARETVRGDADDAMGERRAVEDGGPGGATKEGGGRARWAAVIMARRSFGLRALSSSCSFSRSFCSP